MKRIKIGISKPLSFETQMAKPLSFLFGLFLGLFFNTLAFAELPASVASALKQAGIAQSSVGVFVQAVNSQTASISHNADKSLNPASVMKLVTTHAALDLLSPVFRWKTQVYRDGELLNGLLNGNLIIKGYGDPSLNEAELRRLLVSLKQAGVKRIGGNLVLDKSYFAKNVGPRNTFDAETWRAYNAGPSALMVNGRNTSFKFSAQNGVVVVNQEVEIAEINIINNMQASNVGCGDWRNKMGYSVKPKSNGADITFNGTFSAECGDKYLELSLVDDEKYAFYLFKKLWRELGGQLTGKLKTQENMPFLAVKLVEQTSQPLAYVIRDMNKWSNNMMARQLLLTIAAETQGAPATEAKGEAAIKQWLASKNIQADELVIENGSGLSRIERISAAHLGQMLLNAFQSPIMPELMASLSIMGLDGTAQKRLKDSNLAGRVHLKTGSLDGVSAIAGYMLDKNNKRHVLVMMVNHANAAQAKTAQDALLLLLNAN